MRETDEVDNVHNNVDNSKISNKSQVYCCWRRRRRVASRSRSAAPMSMTRRRWRGGGWSASAAGGSSVAASGASAAASWGWAGAGCCASSCQWIKGEKCFWNKDSYQTWGGCSSSSGFSSTRRRWRRSPSKWCSVCPAAVRYCHLMSASSWLYGPCGIAYDCTSPRSALSSCI